MPRGTILAVRLFAASVWLLSGVVFKLLDVVPRHRQIVAAVVGEAASRPLTLAIGAGEALMGVWILSGARPRTCAAVQTLAIAAMNAVELSVARDLLLAPAAMVCANLALLAAVWYAALRAPLPVRVS
ncbi:MAG TPA: DoxX-like family protein [Planctomycetota bacterium]|nr:DoxX-like family protein [Planctomycetota bacterium]